MAFGIMILLFFMAIVSPRSKMLYWIIISFMWLIFSFNTGAPDTGTYEWLYYDRVPGAFEPVFTAIMEICRILHLPFVGFRMVVATLVLGFLNLTFNCIKDYKTLAMAMYMISPFPWQVSGIRAALACSVLMYALSVFVRDPKRNLSKYVFFVFLATLIHYSSILFLIMVVARKGTSKGRIALFGAFAVLGTVVVLHSDVLLQFVSLFTTREKIIAWLSGGTGKEGFPNWKGFIAELIVLFGNLFLSFYSKNTLIRNKRDSFEIAISRVIYDLNIIAILFIPLLRLNDMYVRLLLIIHGINIVSYAITAFSLQENGRIVPHRNISIISPKNRFCIYSLVVPLWSYAITLYQNLPYFGTPESMLNFLDINILFR